MLPRQNWVGKLTFLFSDLNLKISLSLTKQVAVIRITMQTQTKCFVCFNKVNTEIFYAEPKLPIMPKVWPSQELKS